MTDNIVTPPEDEFADWTAEEYAEAIPLFLLGVASGLSKLDILHRQQFLDGLRDGIRSASPTVSTGGPEHHPSELQRKALGLETLMQAFARLLLAYGIDLSDSL